MKNSIIAFTLLSFTLAINAQVNLEVEGEAKISTMQKKNTADSVVVWLDNGTMAVRDVSTLEKPSPWYLGKDTLGGIVFAIYKSSDGLEHGLIVHHEEVERSWQDTFILSGGDRSWNGAHNTNLMTFSPAKDYVDSLGLGWYLPSIDELWLLRNNRFYVNKSLFSSGDMLLSYEFSTFYWSSTEIEQGRAWALDFGPGAPSGLYKFNKNLVYKVRAIRAF